MDNLSQKIRDFFLEQYQGLHTTNTFLSFEPIGCIINPDDYRDPITYQYSEALITEEISEIVDHVPMIGEVFLPGLDQVGKQYQTLVEGARFNEAAMVGEDKSDYIATFGKARNDALKMLEDADRMSLESVGAKYFPATTIPDTWYDIQSPVWGFKEFEVEKIITETSPTGSELSGKKINFAWRKIISTRLTPELHTEVKAENFFHYTRNLKGIDQAISFKTSNEKTEIRPENKQLDATKRGQIVSKNFLANPPLAKLSLLSKLSKINPVASAEVKGIREQEMPTEQAILRKLFLNNAVSREHRLKAGVALNQNFARLVLNDKNVTETKPVEAKSFSMSFDYCVVQIQRFWFDTTLFNYSKLWYSLALEQGFFSSGIKKLGK